MSLKNWDKKTWLSSNKYINSFNNFLLKQTKINKDSQILDIGCGRGKILGSLSSKLKLRNKPIGIDIENHKDRDKRIDFEKVDAIRYLKKDKKKFDLILIKQTIHFFNKNEIKLLLTLCRSKLHLKGKILIFTLETFQNELPVFLLMKKKLNESLNRDKKIIKFVHKLFPKLRRKNFMFKVKISKNKYIEMIENRFISILLGLNRNEIIKGINEIENKFGKNLKFKDKLICLIFEK